MYSTAPQERPLRNSSPVWPYWSYDAYFLGAQFALWLSHWVNPQSSQGLSVKTYALLLLNFGIITIVYYGEEGIIRALFLVVAMECALWTAYRLATTLRNQRSTILIWVLIPLAVSIVSLLRYNLAVMEQRVRYN